MLKTSNRKMIATELEFSLGSCYTASWYVTTCYTPSPWSTTFHGHPTSGPISIL